MRKGCSNNGGATGIMGKRAQSEGKVSSVLGVALGVGWVLLDAGMVGYGRVSGWVPLGLDVV